MTEIPKVKRGRPAGVQKVKLKNDLKQALHEYNKKYKNESICCVYGIDDMTLGLITALWQNPEIIFYVTDPNQDILANVNRNFSQRSMSMYRWHIASCADFISKPYSTTIVVAAKHIKEVSKLHNPDNVEFIVLEDL